MIWIIFALILAGASFGLCIYDAGEITGGVLIKGAVLSIALAAIIALVREVARTEDQRGPEIKE